MKQTRRYECSSPPFTAKRLISQNAPADKLIKRRLFFVGVFSKLNIEIPC